MARIVISTDGGIHNVELVRRIRGITGESVALVSRRLAHGGAIFDDELFTRTPSNQFKRVRDLIDAISDSGITAHFKEEDRVISAPILLNIMQASETSVSEFDRLSDFGHVA